MDERELDEYWAGYGALSWQDKIRRDGLWLWMGRTNAGIAVALVATAVFLVLLSLGWIGI